MEIMFANKLPFLITISSGIKLVQMNILSSGRRTYTFLGDINTVEHIYNRLGFKIDYCNVDLEFEPLRSFLRSEGIQYGIELNTESKDKPVPGAEIYISTTKERVRIICNTLPFKNIAVHMVVEMVTASLLWINMLPPKD